MQGEKGCPESFSIGNFLKSELETFAKSPNFTIKPNLNTNDHAKGTGVTSC